MIRTQETQIMCNLSLSSFVENTVGIAGFFGFTRGEGDLAESLRAMNRAMVHRGPDEEGVHVEPGLGAGLGGDHVLILRGQRLRRRGGIGQQLLRLGEPDVHVVARQPLELARDRGTFARRLQERARQPQLEHALALQP